LRMRLERQVPSHRVYVASIVVRIIAPGAPLPLTWLVPPEPGHVPVALPPLALLHLPAAGRASCQCWSLRAGCHQSTVYYRFPHSPPPRCSFRQLSLSHRAGRLSPMASLALRISSPTHDGAAATRPAGGTWRLPSAGRPVRAQTGRRARWCPGPRWRGRGHGLGL
jgi:hypothetical protein